MSPMKEVPVTVVDEELVDTVLAPGFEFSGTIRAEKSFMIKGRISGRVETAAELYVAQGAVVHAELRAAQVVVHGEVTGSIDATRGIQLLHGCKVRGDLSAPDIDVEPGADFEGATRITEESPAHA